MTPRTNRARSFRELAPPLLVFVLAMSAGLGVYRGSVAQRDRQLRDDFEFRVRDARTRIETRLATYEQMLRTTKGHLLTAGVQRASFRSFVEASRVHERYPGIQGIGFSVVVPKAQRALHEAMVRAEGYPEYTIRPPGEREPYTAIVFLEPLTGRNLRAFGFDMYSESVRRSAMDLAQRLDDVTISGRVTLLQETDKDVQAGFLMYLPLFTATEPRSLRGWVYAPFRMNDFMAGVLGEREGDLDIDLYDGEVLGAESLMFGRDEPDKRAHPGHLQAEERLTVANHTWTLRVHPRATLAARLGADRSPLVALSGVGVAALLSLLTWTVTQSRAQALALAEDSEGRYRHLLDDVKDAVLIIGPDGAILEANPQASAHFGYTRDELIHLRVADLYAPEARDGVEQLRLKVLSEPHLSFETTHRRKDGSAVESEVSTSLLESAGERTVVCFVRDITARKQAEARLEELNRSLEGRISLAVDELRAKEQLLVTQSRHAAMGEMVANIAHQWRQPLNSLSILVANLQDAKRYGELDDALMESSVGDANQLIQKMSATITDFRDFFRPQKAKEEFSVRAQVEAVIAIVGAAFERSGVTIRVIAERDPRLHGYANEYSQVLLNLVANAKDAIDATGEAGVITITLSERDGLGSVTVRDTGGGIPDAVLPKIFEPYFSTKPMGTGIGLYMSTQIIERNMGGRIAARNVEGGAEITVLCPLASS